LNTGYTNYIKSVILTSKIDQLISVIRINQQLLPQHDHVLYLL
jgi:hypothetical protein